MVGVVALAGAVAACGGDDGGDDGGGTEPPPPVQFTVEGGGNNVPNRYSSDLWIHGAYAYTGTWGGVARSGARGDLVNIWALDAGGAPSLVDSVKIPGVVTVSDLQVSADGGVLVVSTEFGENDGLYVFDLTDPRAPVLLDTAMVAQGLHTATVADLEGGRYVFAARNPGNSANPATRP